MSAIEVIRERGDGWTFADETLTYASAAWTASGTKSINCAWWFTV